MSLRHAILGLLTDGSASGYDLMKRFDESLANVWPATQSQLYTELGRLVDAGHITVVAEGPRGRKEYQITDDGREDLHHWIVDVEPSYVRRSDMLLRVFFLDIVRRDEAVGFLTERATMAAKRRAELTELAQVVDRSTGPLSVTGRIALEWGLRYSACQQDWAEWALEQFQRDRAPERCSRSRGPGRNPEPR